MNTPSLVARRVISAFVLASAFAVTASLTAQIPTRNVNMVSGLEWPLGDPFLQRQNEPSVAASTRNPLHLLAGSNDYRSVDLAGILGNDNEVGDAWAGLYTSTDGGERWTSTLVPGFPHDPDPRGQASPLYGYHAAADPVVRAGTNGLMYFAGLAFDRGATGFGKSAIYVARFIDNNNQEAASPFEYIHTTLVASQTATSGVFLDKPWMAVDIPRQSAGTCNITTSNEHGPFTQRLPAGNIYVAFTVKSTDSQGDRWDLYFSRSTDCGERFSTPIRISRAQDRVNQGASIVISPPTGEVYISWRRIDLNNSDNVEEHAIVVAKSVDQGRKFNNPGVARRFPRGKKKGLDPAGKPGNGKPSSYQAASEFELSPFDQATSDVNKQFRTNAYPTMAADGTGRLYMAWTERGFAIERGDPADGDARIVVATSMDGVNWTTPTVVADDAGQKGHQLMPALSFAGGRLTMIYYDLQEDNSKVFSKYVDDKTAILESNPVRRHTFDVRVSMALPGAAPDFGQSQSVSSYMMGARGATGVLEKMQVNPPNLPMFKLGTVPFIGDYIDLAPSPSFVPTASGGWTYNTASTTTPPVFHAVWTDNRDVKPPFTKDWRDYTPPTYAGPRPDPGAAVVLCQSGLAGSRNQNIYTARITGGLVVGSPQNSKQLSPTLQRAFVVFANNTVIPTPTDDGTRYYRMTILNQPTGGRASFNQYPLPPFTAASEPPLMAIDITVPPFTTASRTVYVTSSDPHAQVRVDVSEIAEVGAPGELPAGLEGLIVLNADILNPEVDNPEVDNPEVDNPEVDNAEVYNPEVDNLDIGNPEVDNPEVDNPEVDNPEVDNIVVGNPEVDNPEVDNPEVDNPEVDNPEVDNPEVDNKLLLDNGGVITDVTWTVKNIGNTTTAYNLNLFLRHNATPADGRAQLLVYRVYKTPIIKTESCDVKTVTQNVLVANIPDPLLVLPGGTPSNPNDSARTNGTVWIEPEKEIRVTVRIFDPIKADNVLIDGASIDPEWIPEADVSLAVQPQPVNTNTPGITEPEIYSPDPSPFLVTTNADSGAGSLREAITLAEATPGYNEIAFNIPGAGPHTIALATLLPNMNEPVSIDGSTQPGYAGVPLIAIDGNGISGGGSGLNLRGGASLVRGLAIGGFGDAGIEIDAFGGNEIYANYIGIDITGTAQNINNFGIDIAAGSDENIIGGLTLAAADRNVISGNGFFGILLGSDRNRVGGNYIGLNAAGTGRVDNNVGVATLGTGNILNGNAISGNFSSGVLMGGTLNVARGNLIGTNAAGTAAVANDIGVVVGGNDNQIGVPGDGNTISGNVNEGVILEGQLNELAGNRIGTNSAGTAALANQVGVLVKNEYQNTIGRGGAGLAGGNLISGNASHGIHVFENIANPDIDNPPVGGGPPQFWVFISANLIGTAANGVDPLGNGGNGIHVTLANYGLSIAGKNPAGGPLAQDANTIAYNAGKGVSVDIAQVLLISRNSIFGNGGLEIDLGDDGPTANDAFDADFGVGGMQNYPVLLGVSNVSVGGEIFSTPNVDLEIEIYVSDNPNDAQLVLLTSVEVTTDPSGHAFIPPQAVTLASGKWVTAVAIGTYLGTSELSPAVLVP